MRAITCALVAALLLQDRQSQDYIGKVKRIEDLLDLLEDKDEKIRKIARAELLQIGTDAIPFIEQRLKLRGLLEHHTLIHDIRERAQQQLLMQAETIDPGDPELQWYAQLAEKIKGLPRDASERYVASRMFEAYAHVLKENYEQADKILTALLALEPRSLYAEKMQQLHRYCENKILASRFLKATAEALPARLKAGDPIRIKLALENRWKNPLSLTYPEQSKGVLVISVEARALEFNGAERGIRREEAFEIENPITIGVGQTWTREIEIQTKQDFEDIDCLRIYSLAARTKPQKIETGEMPILKGVNWPALTVKVVPEKYKGYLDDPLKSLGEVMDGRGVDNGTVNEVFMCAMLVEEERKEAAIALLIKALERANNNTAGDVVIHILMQVTGLRLGGRKQDWLDWWKRRSAEPSNGK